MAGGSRVQWAVETRQLTPAQSRQLLDLLEQLGHDPNRVGELRVTATAFGLRAEVTHRADPAERRIIVPTAAPRTPAPELVITALGG